MLDAKVLISGAGIAGPALAYWLARYGAQVTIVESAPALRTGGQLVDIRGCARQVIAEAGLADTVRAARTAADGLSFVDSAGRRQASVGVEGPGGDGPVTEIEILRGVLSEIFHDATRGTAEYVFGDHVVGMAEQSDGVHVDFARGAARTFDVVIGADGLHSGVRGLLFGPGGVRLRHLGTYLSFWTAENTPELVLAGELARAGGDVLAGLTAYEDALRPWITRIQRFGQGNGKTMTPRTAFGIEIRRRAVQAMGALPRGSLLLRDQIRMSNGFPLPDYTRFEVTRSGR